MSTGPRKWVTLDDAAEQLLVSPRTVRRLIAEGKLPGYTVRGSRKLLRIDQADLDALMIRIPTAHLSDP